MIVSTAVHACSMSRIVLMIAEVRNSHQITLTWMGASRMDGQDSRRSWRRSRRRHIVDPVTFVHPIKSKRSMEPGSPAMAASVTELHLQESSRAYK